MSALGAYVHVPFCATRCGYCDFNTYTATELGGGASQAEWAATAAAEIALTRQAQPTGRQLQTVFFGGGTPTLLPSADLVAVLDVLAREYGLAPDAEVTTEANPDSVTPASLAELRAGGFNRISFGMQSAARHVLATLDRTHDPERVAQAVTWAREAGFAQVSLDLIYGTPGESLADWEASLQAVLAAGVDHVSAYALIVEDGTALARQVNTGQIPAPDDDDMADKYELSETLLTQAGFAWYEVSNWAREEAARCRHNDGYWRSADWLGIGPGAHAHRAGVRTWNLKHPRAWAEAVAAGRLPIDGSEQLTPADRTTERVLLLTRTRDGMPRAEVPAATAEELLAEGLMESVGQRLVLTLRGRLLADAVVRRLLPDHG